MPWFTIAAIVLLLYVGWAVAHAYWRGRTVRQSLLYLPFKIAYRIRDGQPAPLLTQPPVVFVILHQSRLDPALMLSLLPDETLHMLDVPSSRSMWLEPWRNLARTIAFDPRQVFVSRRLVRVLKGGGRLAVYIPDGIEPGTRAFRLYRAIARIAEAAGAELVCVSVRGSRRTGFALRPRTASGWLPRLDITAMPPVTTAELRARMPEGQLMPAAHALYARLQEADGAAV